MVREKDKPNLFMVREKDKPNLSALGLNLLSTCNYN